MSTMQREVTDFITYLIEHAGLFSVEPNPATWGGKHRYTVIQTNQGKPVSIGYNDDSEGPAVVYHMDRDPGKYWVINPFKEADDNKDAGSMWFREVLINNMLKHLATIIKLMTNEQKKSDKYRDVKELIGDIGADFSKDTYSQFAGLADLEKFISVIYDPKTRTGQIQSEFVDWYRENEGTDGGDSDADFLGIKVKNRKVLYNLLLRLFLPKDTDSSNIDKLSIEEFFTYTASTGTGSASTFANNPAPCNEAYIYLYHRVCQKLIPVLEILTDQTYDMAYFDQNVIKIGDYQQRVKHDHLTRPFDLNNQPKRTEVPISADGLPPARGSRVTGMFDNRTPAAKPLDGMPPVRGGKADLFTGRSAPYVDAASLPPTRMSNNDYAHMLPDNKNAMRKDLMHPPHVAHYHQHVLPPVHNNRYTL